MNPYSIPSLICLCVMPFLGAFVYSRNNKSQVHKLFFITASAIFYLAFIEFNLRQSTTYEAAYFWTKAGCFKLILSSLMIHFILAYIGRWNDYDKLKAFSLTYLPMFLLSLLDFLNGSVSGFPVKEYWGWAQGKPVYPAVLLIYFLWKILALCFVGKETIRYLRNARPHEWHSFSLFFYGIMIAAFLATISMYISSTQRPDFPDVSIIIALLFLIYLTYIIWKFNLFLTPADTAEDLIELMEDSLIMTGSHNKILRVNNALLKLSGYSEKELIYENVSTLIKNEPAGTVNKADNEKIISKETRLISKSGQSIPVLLSQTVVRNNGNMPVITVILVKDLTFWYESQKEFAQAEKLESYELIIRGIMHDFNNLLASISGQLEIAGFAGNLPETLKRNIRIAEKATHIAANLIKQLSSYASKNELKTILCQVPDIIQESAELALKGTSIQFAIQTDKNLWPVNADRYKLIQVFINIIINARQAMSDAGKITAACTNYQENETDNFVKIIIKDEGEGIPADIIERIFEPFFTTKQKGSGLGLSIVKNIIETHKGRIAVESQPKMGTAFTILLPVYNSNGQELT